MAILIKGKPSPIGKPANFEPAEVAPLLTGSQVKTGPGKVFLGDKLVGTTDNLTVTTKAHTPAGLKKEFPVQLAAASVSSGAALKVLTPNGDVLVQGKDYQVDSISGQIHTKPGVVVGSIVALDNLPPDAKKFLGPETVVLKGKDGSVLKISDLPMTAVFDEPAGQHDVVLKKPGKKTVLLTHTEHPLEPKTAQPHGEPLFPNTDTSKPGLSKFLADSAVSAAAMVPNEKPLVGMYPEAMGATLPIGNQLQTPPTKMLSVQVTAEGGILMAGNTHVKGEILTLPKLLAEQLIEKKVVKMLAQPEHVKLTILKPVSVDGEHYAPGNLITDPATAHVLVGAGFATLGHAPAPTYYAPGPQMDAEAAHAAADSMLSQEFADHSQGVVVEKNGVQTALTDVEAEVMELLELDMILKQSEPHQKRYDELRKILAGRAASVDYDPSQEVVFSSPNGTVVYSACTNTSEVTDITGAMAVIKQKIGVEAMLAMLKLSTTQIKKSLAPHEYAPFMTTIPGSRKFKAAVAK